MFCWILLVGFCFFFSSPFVPAAAETKSSNDPEDKEGGTEKTSKAREKGDEVDQSANPSIFSRVTHKRANRNAAPLRLTGKNNSSTQHISVTVDCLTQITENEASIPVQQRNRPWHR